ncbi:sprouty-related, EVH1 domain-containing protein 3 [Engraulis encrasicolus]|uniref:sprouty-related, EVH1 domain-containing protein 3 n=1 Tax=Engraulis encrasicolus TaxID=184585 RepID=UPI002FD0C9D4
MEGDVRVRAVVMTWDEVGWVALDGGGLSHVVICKRRSSDGRGRKEYIIHGERLRDRASVLECVVQRGLVYNKVSPLFHHWRVEDRKFGLTFQSSTAADSFEQGLQSVLDKLERGSESPSSSTPEEGDIEDDQASHTGSDSSSSSQKVMLPKPITIVTSQSSPRFARSAPEDFDDGTGHAVTTQTPAQIHTRPTQQPPVLNPPAPPLPPPAPPTTPPLAPLPLPPSSPLSPLLPTIPLLVEDLRSLDCNVWGSKGYEDYRRGDLVGGLTGGVVVPGGGGGGGGGSGPEKHVVRYEKELAGVGTAECEVTIALDPASAKGSGCHHSSPTCPSMPNAVSGMSPMSGGGGSSPQEPTGKGSPSPCCIHTSDSRTRRRGGGAGGGDAISPDEDSPCPQGASSCSSRCVYCRSVFSQAENGRGRCRDAPDPALHCLRQWTCVWCAESLLYHCMSDSEGEFWEPCDCECEDSLGGAGGRAHPLCCARWLALLALSLFVPCMCCYLPLRACLRCGERCGCCGGKHKAVR